MDLREAGYLRGVCPADEASDPNGGHMLDLMSIDGGSLITAALATGAQTGATETVKAGVQLLKDKLKSVFTDDDDALAVLTGDVN